MDPGGFVTLFGALAGLRPQMWIVNSLPLLESVLSARLLYQVHNFTGSHLFGDRY
jgi:hypothetical protein